MIKPLESRTAVVTISIQPNCVGQVRFRGAWWAARCLEPISIQEQALVNVTGQHDITTLLVRPIMTEINTQ